MLNSCHFMGRFTLTPELQHTKSGIAKTIFCLAVDKDIAKTPDREPDYIDFVAWRNNAEFICKHFIRGQQAVVVGSLNSTVYLDSAGNRRKKTEVTVDDIYFTGKREAAADEPADNSMPPPKAFKENA